jgi:SAM-dependent methyltransferase
VTLTDQDCLLFLLEENKKHFSDSLPSIPPEQVQIELYEWEHLSLPQRSFDLVLVSDCVLPKLYPIDLLLLAVDRVLGPSSTALFSYEHRPFPEFDPRHEFARLSEARGLRVRVVPLDQHDDLFSAEDIEIWEVSRAGCARDTERDEQVLSVLTWGSSLPEVRLVLGGIDLTVKQDVVGAIGSVLWPSSVIASRFLSCVLSSKI